MLAELSDGSARLVGAHGIKMGILKSLLNFFFGTHYLVWYNAEKNKPLVDEHIGFSGDVLLRTESNTFLVGWFDEDSGDWETWQNLFYGAMKVPEKIIEWSYIPGR